MKTIKLAFNPNDLKPSEDAYAAFSIGGITLKFWALYKQRHITNQHFRGVLVELGDYFDKAFDPEEEDTQPYTNIDEFMLVLERCGARHSGCFGFGGSGNLARWVAEHWDYFNLNIQRAVSLEYQVVEPVTKTMVVGALTGREFLHHAPRRQRCEMEAVKESLITARHTTPEESSVVQTAASTKK